MSISWLQFDLSEITPIPAPEKPLPPLVVIYGHGTSTATRQVERYHGLTLLTEAHGQFSYRVAAGATPEALEALAAKVADDPAVVSAFVDVEGAAHTQWTRAETVDLNIRPDQTVYHHRVLQNVTARESKSLRRERGESMRRRGRAEGWSGDQMHP